MRCSCLLFIDDADVKDMSASFIGEEAGSLGADFSLVLEEHPFTSWKASVRVELKGKKESGKHSCMLCGPLEILHVMQHEGLANVHLSLSEPFIRKGVL